MDWGSGHLTIIVGTGTGHLPTKIFPQGRAFDQYFQMPGVCPGGGCSRLELTCTLYIRSIIIKRSGNEANHDFLNSVHQSYLDSFIIIIIIMMMIMMMMAMTMTMTIMIMIMVLIMIMIMIMIMILILIMMMMMMLMMMTISCKRWPCQGAPARSHSGRMR